MRTRRIAYLAAVTGMLMACGGGAGGLGGQWTKSMSGEGDVTMNISGGKATIELPSPRWPAEKDLLATLSIAGDSLTIADECGPAACG